MCVYIIILYINTHASICRSYIYGYGFKKNGMDPSAVIRTYRASELRMRGLIRTY